MSAQAIRDVAKDLLDELTTAVRRIEMANAEGNPILSAWLPDARAAIENARRQLAVNPVDFLLTEGGIVEHPAPSVLDDIARCAVHYRCDNCNAGYHSISELKPVTDLEQRVAPGELVPVGECPACGAVVHPEADDWWPVPQSAIDRHYLSGQFNLSQEAMPLVQKMGLDRLLAWFEKTRNVHIGDTLPVGDSGLKAYFGFDLEKPNGEGCYVNVTVLR